MIGSFLQSAVSIFNKTSKGGVFVKGKSGKKFDFRDEFSTMRAVGAVNSSACEPGPGSRTVVDTESCLSIIPNFGAAIATHAGVTFGGSNNRCSYADDYAWMDFPVGFNAAAHANQGRIVIMYDAAGRAAWGFLGAAGEGVTVGVELVPDSSFDVPATWIKEDGTVSVADGVAIFASSGNGISIYQFNTLPDFGGKLCVRTADVASIASGAITTLLPGQNYTDNPLLSVGVNIEFVVMLSELGNVNVITRSAGTSATINSFSVKQVLTPSATGCKIYRDAACTVNGWNKPAAFNMNSAAYTFGIYQPASGGKLFFQGGKTTPAYGDPGLWKADTIRREAGKVVAFKIASKGITYPFEIGLDTDKSDYILGPGWRSQSATQLFSRSENAFNLAVLRPLAPDIDTILVVVLRANGAHFFRKTDVFKYDASVIDGNITDFYAVLSNYNITALIDFIRIPKTRWLPTPLLSDGFSAADATSNDGRASDGAGHAEVTGLGSGGIATWNGASGAIQGGRLVITPTLGAELNTDVTLDGAIGAPWIRDDNSWTISGGKAVATSMPDFKNLNQNLATIGAWYRMVFDQTVTAGLIYGQIGTLSIRRNNSNGITFTGRATNNIGPWFWGAAGPTTGTIDNVSYKQITLSTCFNTVALSTVSIEIKTAFIYPEAYQVGVVLSLNEAGTSFIIAYHDGDGSIKLEICEAGTYTTKATVVAAYEADAELRVRRDGLEIWVYYNNVLIGAGPTTTLSAGEGANLSGLKAGLFSTSELNSFNACTVYATGTGNEYSILDRLIGA